MNNLQIQNSESQTTQICQKSQKQERKAKQIKVKWTQTEHKKYIQFLSQNLESFLNTYKRRSNKVFKQLSNILITKTANQCKSHHQKSIMRFGTLLKMMAHYQLIRDFNKQENKVIEKPTNNVPNEIDNKYEYEFIDTSSFINCFMPSLQSQLFDVLS